MQTSMINKSFTSILMSTVMKKWGYKMKLNARACNGQNGPLLKTMCPLNT